MSDNLELDRRVLRQLMYTGMLKVGRSELLEKINDMFAYGVQMHTAEMLLKLISSKEQREMFGNIFSTVDSHMYMNLVGPFVALLPCYSSGQLDLALFNDPENVKQLYDYTENTLEYLNGRLYVEIPIGLEFEFRCPTNARVSQSNPGKQHNPFVNFKQRGSIYGNYYHLNLEDDETTHVLVHDGLSTKGARGVVVDMRVQNDHLIFTYDSEFYTGGMDKHFLHRRLREVIAIEAWLHMVETGEVLDLNTAKKDLAQLILLDGNVTGAISRGLEGCYVLDMKYYQR